MDFDWIEKRPQGLWIRPAGLFLDALQPVPVSLTTHAHGDHFHPDSQRLIATPGTLAFLQHRIRKKPEAKLDALAYGEVIEQNGVAFRLIPAGHMPGSAMVEMDWKGERVLYTGDFNPRAHPMAEPMEFPDRKVDLLITEATFTARDFAAAEPETELKNLVGKAPEHLPILLGVYSLGKAQRMIHLIHQVFPGSLVMAHPFTLAYNRIYENLGFPPGPAVPYRRKWKNEPGSRTFILMPPSEFRRMAASNACFSAFVSGWDKRNPAAGIQEWLPISDHPDRSQLREFIRKIAPSKVMPVHGNGAGMQDWSEESGFSLIL